MRVMKWFSFLAATILIASCFLPWVIVPEKNIIISGVDASDTNYGRPGYLNLLMSVLFIAFTFIQRLWAKRCNMGVAAINLAWTFRNYLILTRCEMGDCPVVENAFYVYIIVSVLMLVGALVTDTGKEHS